MQLDMLNLGCLVPLENVLYRSFVGNYACPDIGSHLTHFNTNVYHFVLFISVAMAFSVK